MKNSKLIKNLVSGSILKNVKHMAASRVARNEIMYVNLGMLDVRFFIEDELGVDWR